MLDTRLRKRQSPRRGVGHEEVGSVAESCLDAVLQETVRHVDGWPEQFLVQADRLTDDVAAMEDDLQIECPDCGTSDADVISCGESPFCTSLEEGLVDRSEPLDDLIAMRVER